MDRKFSGLVLAIIFVLSDSASSALININETRDLGSLPEHITFMDDNAVTSSRSKRQVALESSASADANPPIAGAPLAENQPAQIAVDAAAPLKPTIVVTKATAAPTAPAATQSTSDGSAAAANVVASGFDTIDQLSQVGDQIGQRLSNRLDKLQTGVDTLVSSQVDAITDLFKSGLATGVKIPTTGLKLFLAKLRLPLFMFG